MKKKKVKREWASERDRKREKKKERDKEKKERKLIENVNVNITDIGNVQRQRDVLYGRGRFVQNFHNLGKTRAYFVSLEGSLCPKFSSSLRSQGD